jgi:hypothetical protein
MAVCPNVSLDEWTYLEERLGGTVEATREFSNYAHLENPEQVMARVFNPETYSNEEKIKALKQHSAQFTAPDDDNVLKAKEGELERLYTDDKANEYTPINTALDLHKDTRYLGKKIDDRYTTIGKQVHKVMWRILEKGDNLPSLQAAFPQFPDSALIAMLNTADHYKTLGRVVSEIPLGMKGVNRHAGTPDVIIFKDDGGIIMIDFKTVHQQRENQTPDDTLWKIDKNGYKARRYSAQQLSYGELLLGAIDQAPSEYLIQPVEIFYKDPNAEADALEVDVLGMTPNNLENIREYGAMDTAQKVVDQIFSKVRDTADFELGNIVDDSTNMLSGMLGLDPSQLDNFHIKEITAKAIVDDPVNQKPNHYWTEAGGWRKYHSKNRGERINQVIREAVELDLASSKDLYGSVLNIVKHGIDPSLGGKARVIPQLLGEYAFSNSEVIELDSLQGFQQKRGWILIKRGNKIDLVYAGTDNFDSRLAFKGENLFSNINPKANQLYGGMENTVREYKSLEGFLIAAQMMASNSDWRLGAIKLYSDAESGLPSVVNPYTVFDAITKLHQGKELPVATHGSLDGVVDLNPERFEVNFIQAHADALADIKRQEPTPEEEKELEPEFLHALRKDRARRKRVVSMIEQFSNDIHKQKALTDQLLREVNNLKRIPRTDRTFAQQKELESMALMWLQLNNMGKYDTPISNKLEGNLKMRTFLPGELMKFLNSEITLQKLKFSDIFLGRYKKPSNEVFKSFFLSQGHGNLNVRDRIVGDTTRLYEDLFEKTTYLNEEENGKEVLEKSMKLVREGSDAYLALNPGQKALHAHIREVLQQAAEIQGTKWDDDHQLPLITNSLSNSLYKNWREKGGIRESAKHWWEQLTDNKEFSDNIPAFRQKGAGQAQESIFEVSHYFKKQNDPKHISNMMGLAGKTITNMNTFRSFETNIEKILDMTMANAVRVATMARLSSTFAMAHTIYEYQASNLLGDAFKFNLDWVEKMNTVLIHNQDIDSGTIENSVAKAFNKATTYMTIAFNIKSAAVVTLGQELVSVSRALANTWIDDSRYNLKDLKNASAFMLNPKTAALAQEIIDLYTVQDGDSTSLTNGIHSVGNRSLISNKWSFALHRAGDRITKGQMFIAHMFHDGSINAHSLNADGELVYNVKNDPRFKGKKGKSLYKAVLAAQTEEQFLIDGELGRAYDLKTTGVILNEISLAFGGTDKDMRVLFSFHALGRVFTLHKSFFPAIFARAMQGRINDSDVFGKWEQVKDEETGEWQTRWRGGSHEGIFATMFGIIKQLTNYKNQRRPLDQIQKDNLKRITADAVMMTIMMGIAAALSAASDDEDAIDWGNFLRTSVIGGAMRDVLAAYNMQIFTDAFTPIAVDVTLKTMKRLFNALGYSITKGDPRDLAEELLNVTALTRQFEKEFNFIQPEQN